MLTVLSWFWQQPEGRSSYSAFNVNVWADMVRRNLSWPHRIACVTATPEGIDPSIEIIKPPGDFENWRIPSWGEARPQCLRRIAMFGPNAGQIFGDEIVCMDLDCVIGGPLDPLFEDVKDFAIFRGTTSDRAYNGSMMYIRAGARTKVYDTITLEAATKAGKLHLGSDQAWIAYCLGPKEQTWGPEHGVHFWQGYRRGSLPGTRILFFPGSIKPWELIEDDEPSWISKHYARSPRGRALLLGHAQNVWEEAEEATLNSDFDAVIASPEAAAHWPVDVLAVARDDRHAERLAYLHGYRETVFCGRTERENDSV